MAAHAFLLKDGYSEAESLDQSSWTDYYHVVGIEGWTPSNTRTVVFAAVPSISSTHPDSTRAAIVVERRIVEKIDRPAGTYQDGAAGEAVVYTTNTSEAIVAVTWSSRRPFSLYSAQESSDVSVMESVRIPGFTRLTAGQADPLWYQTRASIGRATMYRTRSFNVTGIDNTERTFLELLTGSLVYFPFPIQPGAAFDPDEMSLWVLASAAIERNRFNQDIVTYRFVTKQPLRGYPSEFDIPIPDLQWLQEWDVPEVQNNTTDPPNPIPKLTATEIYRGANLGTVPLNFYSLPGV
jgi:hypothetical protein